MTVLSQDLFRNPEDVWIERENEKESEIPPVRELVWASCVEKETFDTNWYKERYSKGAMRARGERVQRMCKEASNRSRTRAILLAPKPEPVVAPIKVEPTVEKPVEVVIFKIDKRTMFQFKTGVVVQMDFLHGEVMQKGSSGVRVYSYHEAEKRLLDGYQFTTKHQIIQKGL
jgi:hypothetical protein